MRRGMRALPALWALLTIVVSAAAPAAVPRGAAGVLGTWINPARSVAVETTLCGDRLCGRVRWASADAMKDAADAGSPALIGLELLQDYRPGGSGNWHGRVFVPDMGRSFASTIAPQGADAMRVSGCLIGGFLCKSEVWHRL